MTEELNLVRDLAVILISASIFTIISKALKQPLVLGYIIAGFLVGPHITFFPSITDPESVEQWSEIGIIFLMFGLGLEFSFKKLLKVGSSAIVTAITKFLGVFVLGFVTAQAMSWSLMESIFLGGLLSMSSTMVVIKSYDEMGLKNRPHAGMVFGTLVVEDLIAILLMVLLSTMAVSQSFAGKELVLNMVKLVFFLVLWFLVGIYIIPTALRKASPYINSEILLIVSLGLCFGMVSLAESVGFSSALGAFVMGSILSETIAGDHIDKIVEPIKNLFGAIFFVSVGMMVDPAVIMEHWATILLITFIVIVSHIIFSAAGIILTGKGLENGVNVGFSLAQLGEFGFIIAGVGTQLGVMRDFIYPVIISVSVITTFTTPYMIRLAEPALGILRKKLSPKILQKLEAVKETRRTASEESEWKKLLKAYFMRIGLYGVVLIAIFIGSNIYLGPFLDKVVPSLGGTWRHMVEAGITLLVMSPFIYGLGVGTGSISPSATKLLKEKQSNLWPILGLAITRTFLAVAVVLEVITTYFSLAGWTVLLLLIAGFVFIIITRRSMHRISMLEKRFLANYNAREESERLRKPVSSTVRKELESYDVYTEVIQLSADSSFAGSRLMDLPLRSESGANIIKIARGSDNIIVPSGEVVLFPGDEMLAVGTSEQLSRFKKLFENSIVSAGPKTDTGFKIEAVTLSKDSFLTGTTLRSHDLRRYRCMIISVLHDSIFITNPEPDFKFSEGDTVWIAGDIAALGLD